MQNSKTMTIFAKETPSNKPLRNRYETRKLANKRDRKSETNECFADDAVADRVGKLL